MLQNKKPYTHRQNGQSQDLPSKDQVSQILDSKYEMPKYSHRNNGNIGTSPHKKNSQKQQINKFLSPQNDQNIAPNDNISDRSLQSARHFYSKQLSGNNKQRLPAVVLKKKLMNLQNGRQVPMKKKDWDQFSTEYKQNFENRNNSVPVLQPLPIVKEEDKFLQKQQLKQNFQNRYQIKTKKSITSSVNQSQPLISKTNLPSQSKLQTEANERLPSKNTLELTPKNDSQQKEQLVSGQNLEENTLAENTEEQQGVEQQYTDSQLPASESQQKPLSQDVITQYQLQSFMEENQEYFQHLKGECSCLFNKGKGKCPYKTSQLKPELNTNSRTLYKTTFNFKQPYQSNEALDVRKYANKFADGKTMDLQTTNKNDYIPHQPNKNIASGRNRYKQQYPFIGNSTYGNEFIDFQAASAFIPVKQSSDKTVVAEMPFHGHSLYQQDFIKKDNILLKPTMNSYMTTQVQSPIPFMAETTNKKYYKPYKSQAKPQYQKAENELKVGADDFKGQFKSQYQDAFVSQSISIPGEKIYLEENKKPKNFAKIKSPAQIRSQLYQQQQSPSSRVQEF